MGVRSVETPRPETAGIAETQAPKGAKGTPPTFGPIRRWRNALLSNARFQAIAAALPFTRPVARRQATQLFNLCTGFVHSQVLLACVKLDVFAQVADAPLSAEGLASRSDLPAEGAERLLKAAAALGLLDGPVDEHYTLGDMGAALMGNPSVFAMIQHHGDLYKDLADPVALLKARTPDTRLARYWRYGQAPDPTGAEANDVTDYSALMAETQGFIARDVLAAYDMKRHRRMMDIGGGNGAFLRAVGQRHPHLHRTLCDLPAVADLARAAFEAAEEAPDAVRVFGLDAFHDSLPDDCDLISLVRILHDHDDGPVRTLLANIRQSLTPGGRLLIAEPMAGTPGAEPMGESYFGLYLWAMGSGRPRTAKEIKALLREAGFRKVRELGTNQPLLVRCLIAE